MAWYAAHIILYTKFLDGIQNTYPVWENVILIHASTSDEAFARADRKGLSEAGGEGYTYDGRPAAWVYAGVRTLSECLEDFDPLQRAAGGVEEHGTEVTYSSFILDSEATLQRLVAGKSVSLVYEGNRDEDRRVRGSNEWVERVQAALYEGRTDGDGSNSEAA
jgi:hypothetical protein